MIVSKNGKDFDKFDNFLQHRHPVSVKIDTSNQIFVGDSLGDIHIYYYNEQIDDQLFV
jgi:hypothetical protein